MSQLVILGCGYSCRRFVALYGEGFERIAGTSRKVSQLSSPPDLPGVAPGEPRSGEGRKPIIPSPTEPSGSPSLAASRLAGDDKAETPAFLPLGFDGQEISPELAQELAEATHLLVSIPPGPAGDIVLPLLKYLAMPALGWIGYLSTVGVYGDAGGGWIDEDAPLRPESPRNRARAEAEAAWTEFALTRGVPLQIFRIAGIYGPGRNALKNLREGTAKRIVKPGQVFNRIHVDDIAGAIAAGMARPHLAGPVNLADDEPAPPQDVVTHAAGLLGVPPPPEVPFAEAEMTPMARSFYSANKRVSNRRLRERFGYALRYPTFREAFADLLRDEG